MFRKILLVFICVFFTLNASALNPFVMEIKDTEKNAFFIAPKIGCTLSNMTQPNGIKLYDGSGIGFSAGVEAKIRLGKATENSPSGTGCIGLSMDFLYKQNSVKTVATDLDGNKNVNLSLSYLEIPVAFQFSPFVKSATLNTLYIEVGAALALNMGRSPKYLTVTNPTPQLASMTFHLDDDKSTLKASDIKPLVGIGYTFPNVGLGVNARYYLGMSKIAANLSSKLSSAEVSIYWQFKVGQF